jgi:hypothetical protein
VLYPLKADAAAEVATADLAVAVVIKALAVASLAEILDKVPAVVAAV